MGGLTLCTSKGLPCHAESCEPLTRFGTLFPWACTGAFRCQKGGGGGHTCALPNTSLTPHLAPPWRVSAVSGKCRRTLEQ